MNSDPGDEEIAFELLANKYSRKILSLTSIKECSAAQLSQELGIPLATVYRKIKLMESTGLIQHVKTIINFSGNEEKYYRCAIREATVRIHNGLLSVDFKKEDHSDKIIRLWKRFAHPNNGIT
ncbi:MAG: helix-turn-helix transcriptional regulator [Candidatus Methanoperedens sp.]|nr:helix-turn-helix transcriptional regulator [Candidatus Methanoperedens sp.]MCE8427130.1 helix-turn-helix transcriptional regulator [Candidatus Methanoperedens sp.]